MMGAVVINRFFRKKQQNLLCIFWEYHSKMSQIGHRHDDLERIKAALIGSRRSSFAKSKPHLNGMTEWMIICLLICLSFLPSELKAMSMMDTLVKKEIMGYRQERWCEEHGGQARTVLADQTRIDCLTATHAIKFEAGSDWDRAIGQVLFYGLKTNKKLGILLILETEEDQNNWQKMNSVIKNFQLPVQAWKLDK